MEARDSANSLYLSQPGIQPWSKGDHFPAIIIYVEHYNTDHVLVDRYHEVLLNGVTHEFRGANTYDQAHAWAMIHKGD